MTNANAQVSGPILKEASLIQTSAASIPAALSDEKLFILCKSYGLQAKIWKQKFIGLLPEVNRRRLYERKGFSSIFDFAVKLAGISEMQVRRVINMERSLANTPALQQMLLKGEVSISKLVRVVSIASPANQQALADQLKLLPNRALETFVRDEKTLRQSEQSGALGEVNSLQASLPSGNGTNPSLQNPIGFPLPQNDLKSVHVHTLSGQSGQSGQSDQPALQNSQAAPTYTIDINKDLQLLEKLSPQLKEKLFELTNKGIDINDLLLQLIIAREKEIAAEKEKISAEINAKINLKSNQGCPGPSGHAFGPGPSGKVSGPPTVSSPPAHGTTSNPAPAALRIAAPTHSPTSLPATSTPAPRFSPTPSRHIPAVITRLIKKEHGSKCSVPTCNKPARTLHHTGLFALGRTHDPKFIAPLCKEHHIIAHSLNLKFMAKIAPNDS